MIYFGLSVDWWLAHFVAIAVAVVAVVAAVVVVVTISAAIAVDAATAVVNEHAWSSAPAPAQLHPRLAHDKQPGSVLCSCHVQKSCPR